MKLKRILAIVLALMATGCEYNPFDDTQRSINETLERVITSLQNNDCELFLEELNPAQRTKSFTVDDCRYNFSDRNYLHRWILITQFAKSSKGKLSDAKNEYTVDLKPLGINNSPPNIRLIKLQDKWYITD